MYEVESGGHYSDLRFSFGAQRCGGQCSFIVPVVVQERNEWLTFVWYKV